MLQPTLQHNFYRSSYIYQLRQELITIVLVCLKGIFGALKWPVKNICIKVVLFGFWLKGSHMYFNLLSLLFPSIWMLLHGLCGQRWALKIGVYHICLPAASISSSSSLAKPTKSDLSWHVCFDIKEKAGQPVHHLPVHAGRLFTSVGCQTGKGKTNSNWKR